MIYVHSVKRPVRYYPDWPALCVATGTLTFSELDSRVRKLVASLIQAGFKSGDRLALLLPNGPDYIALVYACAWLGVIAVPINVRLAAVEIDHVLGDASPRGLVRHSSLPAPGVSVPWEVVLDQDPLPGLDAPVPDPCYNPDAILALIYTSGTTGRPKGVIVTHANILANVHNLSYWVRYREGGVYLHSAPIFHIADFPAMFAAPAFGVCQATLPGFHVQSFCEAVATQHVN